MRRSRLWLGVAGAALALLVACVWVVPGMLDWNRYREGIAALASQRLGRAVHIGGGVSLHLLPQPVLTASDVAVEEVPVSEGGDGIGLRAGALRLRVGLGSLLAGRVDARELTLQGAEVRLPWPPPAGALSQRPPAWITGLEARIEDGRLQVGELVLSGIDATLSTDPDTGTLSVAGVGQTGARDAKGGAGPGARSWQFTARLARPGRDGAAGLDVSLDGQGRLRDTGGTFSGTIGGDGSLAGRVAGRGPDLSALMPAPALAWRGDGRLSAAGGLAVADELALEIGGAPARGAVALRVTPAARLDLAIAAGRLDLDAWLPALLARNPDSVRAGVPTGIDLSAEAATLAGGTLRRLRAAIDLEGGAIHLREVAAVLPGEATLGLSGEVGSGEVGSGARFEGAVKVAAPDLRTTLRWVQRFLPGWVAALPGGVLRTADVSGQVKAAAGQWAVSELRGTVDGGQVGGGVSVRAGARLAVTAGLTVDRLGLEGWVPDPSSLSVDAAAGALAALLGMDAEVRLQVAEARWGTAPLGAVTVELQSDAARVFLRRLEAQPLGTRLMVAGQVAEGGRLTDGKVELTAPDLRVFAPFAASLPGGWGGLAVLLRGPGSAVVQAAGPPDALAGRVVLELADLRVEAKPVANLPARRWSGALTLHHPGAPRLLEVLGVGGTAAWLGDGSLSLVGQVAAGAGRVELEGATLAAGAFRASGRVAVEGRRVTGQVSAESLPLPLVYPRSPEPLPVGWLRGWQAAVRLEAAQVLVGLSPVLQGVSGDLTLEGGVLRVGRGSGRLAGGTVSGSAMLDASADPPRVAVQAQATGLGVAGGVVEGPLDVVAGQVGGTLDVSAAGHSPAALLATVQGIVVVRVRDGVVAGLDLAGAGAALGVADGREAMAGARGAMLGGSTPFGALDATLTLSRGVVGVEGTLASAGGSGTLRGSADVPGGSVDLRVEVTPALVGGAPVLGLRVTGPAGAPARVPELAGLARWLAERPASP